MLKLVQTLEVHNELGEGVIWDSFSAKLWWTDIQQSKLFRYDPETQCLDRWITPERLCCMTPRANGQGLVAAFESGFAFYQPESNHLEWIKRIETDNPGTRFNDGKTDRQGRLWAGTMVEDKAKATAKGHLYCLHPDLSISQTMSGLLIPNSLCWSPDGQIMYHTDTPSQTINQYQYNTENATFGQGKVFTKTNEHCFPDGSTVDSKGGVWNAQWGGKRVVRYTPTGEQDLQLDIPAKQVTCVAFGGKDLNLLFVTSAWQGLDKDARDRDPQAGNLFIYQTDFTGVAESHFPETNSR